MQLQKFQAVHDIAAERKGGRQQLEKLLPTIETAQGLKEISDDRYLSMMTRCINQAGFSWKVIEQKWPAFEEAFFGFSPDKLRLLSDEQWEAYTKDTRIVRNWQKIKAVKDNLVFVLDICQEHGSFGEFIAEWPENDQIGLCQVLKKRGARLGGYTGARFLRNMGKDVYILTPDVVATLQRAGMEIPDNPTAQRDLKAIQAAFNRWHDETGLPYAHLSRIAACSIGDNVYT